MIETQHLCKRFGDTKALDDFSFKIKRGEIYGLVGPNGAGKTTLSRIIAGIMKPSSGTVFIGGKKYESNPQEFRRMIGYHPEEPHLYENLSAQEILEFFGDLYGVPPEDIKKRAKQLLDIVGLSERANDKVEVYSKGMRHRLALARALIHDPQIILLDEPTMGLDPLTSRIIRDYVKELKKQGKTILLCTHYMNEAEMLCDRIGIINMGRKIAEGEVSELKAKLKKHETYEIVFEQVPKGIEKKLAACKSVLKFSFEGKKLTVNCARGCFDLIAAVLNGYKVSSIHSVEPSLDDVFIEFIGNRKGATA